MGKIIRLTKLSGEKSHETSLTAGQSIRGKLVEWSGEPKVGIAFGLDTEHMNDNDKEMAGIIGYRTSQVKEILSPNTFRTYNSVYKWEVI